MFYPNHKYLTFLDKSYSNGKIKIENKNDLSPNEELMDDVFVAKRNGLRKYNITNKKTIKIQYKWLSMISCASRCPIIFIF